MWVLHAVPSPQRLSPSMVTPNACNPTLLGPPRSERLHSPLSRGGAIQLRPAPSCTGAHRAAAGGGRRRQGRRLQLAGGRRRRPLSTARYCFQNTPARGIPQTADEAPPPERHAVGWPMVSGTPSPGLGGCQGLSRMYEPSLGNIARGRAKFLLPPETHLEHRRPHRFRS